MALSSLLSIARTALQVHQRAVDVAGHNIANASTPGYSRQRLRLQPQTPLRHPQGFKGRGVEVTGIERARNRLLDVDVRRESGAFSQFTNLGGALAKVQEVLGEPSDTGLAATLDAFWGAWGDLANAPANRAVRTALRGIGGQVARTFNTMAGRLDGLRADTLAELRADVAEANRIAARIADLNRTVLAAGDGGAAAPDLQDQRDLLLDQLAGMASVQVVEEGNGSLRVMVGDVLVVDRTSVRALAVTTNVRGEPTISLADGSAAPRISGGRLSAHLDVLRTVIPDVLRELDAVVGVIVDQVNTLHRGGARLDGIPAGDFFAAVGVTAGTMALSADVSASADAIAAGSGSGPGDGSVALAIAALRDATLAVLGGQSITGYFASLVTDVGQDVREAEQFAAAHEALSANAENRRAALVGVSIDEEMVNLILSQQAYAAAARLVTVADEMIQEILRSL